MDNNTYCKHLNELLITLSTPIENTNNKYENYIKPIINELRIANYITVLKELSKKCKK